MTKFLFALAMGVTSFALYAQENNADIIDWPENYEPSRSKFYVENEITINAPPESVWTFLIDALQWESWYKGAKEVFLKDPAEKVLMQNSVFEWQTMGLKFESVIQQYEPTGLLAWESRKRSIQGFHVWLIIPTDNGCKVITCESQKGWLTFFEKTFQPKKLKKLHDIWLLGLKKKSEGQ